jgi:CDP-diacylglycerol--serine O-phosphatidyltransferase
MKLFTIPNIITLGNLLCGIMGLISLQNGDVKQASILILIALILDFLDGFIARMTNSYSDIGKQLDSLADMVSFGVLPSMILFHLLNDAGHLVYVALLPAMASALRLAKFNIDERQSDSFRGLPTPANAMVIAAFPFILDQGFTLLNTDYILAAYAVIISYIMISDIPMLALKFKTYAWKSNQIRFIFLILSIAFLLLFEFAGVPLILLLYIGISIFSKPTI